MKIMKVRKHTVVCVTVPRHKLKKSPGDAGAVACNLLRDMAFAKDQNSRSW